MGPGDALGEFLRRRGARPSLRSVVSRSSLVLGLVACIAPVLVVAAPLESLPEFVFADAVAAFNAANDLTSVQSPAAVMHFVKTARRALYDLTRKVLKEEERFKLLRQRRLQGVPVISSESAETDVSNAEESLFAAQGDSSFKEYRHSGFSLESWRDAASTEGIAAFHLTEIPSYATGGVSNLKFQCRLKEGTGKPRRAMLCEARGEEGEGLIFASIDLELSFAGRPAPWSAKSGETFECRLRFQRENKVQSAFVQGLAGLCASWGYSRQVFTNAGRGKFFDILPELGAPTLLSLGFSVNPTRFVDFPSGIEVAAVNPNEDRTHGDHSHAEKEQERRASSCNFDELKKQISPADFVPLRPLDKLAWSGLPTDTEVYRHYLDKAKEGLAAATLTEGLTSAHAEGCSFSLGLKKEHFNELRRLKASLCEPGSPLLPCAEQLGRLTWSVSKSRMEAVLFEQIQALLPSPLPGGADRMVQMLMRPEVWWLLQRLLGGHAARRRESLMQREWYDDEMLRVSPFEGRKLKFNKFGKSPTVLHSEVLRFSTLFLDLLPSKHFWNSFKLPCIQEALGYLEAFSSVWRRQDLRPLAPPQIESQGPVLLEANEDNRANWLQIRPGISSTQSPTFLQTEDLLALYRHQHETAISRGAEKLEPGKTLFPLSASYQFADLKALAEQTAEGHTSYRTQRSEDDAAALRRLWLESPAFSNRSRGQVAFSVKGVPSRKGEALDLQFVCTDSGSFPISRNLVGWNSRFLCEPVYGDEGLSVGVEVSGKFPRFRLIGFEFEVEAPHRCGVSYLGNEHETQVTDVKGQDLLRVFLGFCWLHGFETAWILDSVRDVYSHERMRYTMALEKGKSFYEHAGFLFSINTIKARSRADSCLAFFDGDSDSGASEEEKRRRVSRLAGDSQALWTSSGLCRVRRDLLQNPGFEPSVLFPLHKQAFETLYNLTFDCNQPEWRDCNSSDPGFYPLSQKLPDGRCAFEENPLWMQLAEKFPDHCGFGKRIGECHKAVRKQLGCKSRKKEGCRFLLFLYESFVYPGGNYRHKLPLQIADAWDEAARDLVSSQKLDLKKLLIDALKEELKECETGRASEAGLCPAGASKDGRLLLSLLEQSVLILDLTGLPQFWSIAQLARRASNKAHHSEAGVDAGFPTEALPERRCPAAFAWAFITRLQGQLYRHRTPKQTVFRADVRKHGSTADASAKTKPRP